MKCEECGWNYPQHILAAYRSSTVSKVTCGICALALSNALHKIERTSFTGLQAERARQQAIKWRTQHPECAA